MDARSLTIRDIIAGLDNSIVEVEKRLKEEVGLAIRQETCLELKLAKQSRGLWL